LLILQAIDLPEQLAERFPWAMDFLFTPLREAEVRTRVRRLLAGGRAPERHSVHPCTTETIGLAQLVGEDPAFVTLKRKLPLLAQCEAPVLLRGETGTGKGLCARSLHYLSRRAGQPFLPVNCGAIPVDLFERELFGHQKGAFTGAWAAQPGLIAEAEGGTLFLDEIETISLEAQAKLLGFLDAHTYHALGSPRSRQADVWIIAATNAELPRKVREGMFREDLFYRLAVLTLTLPPLRERRTDIPRLVAHVWARYANQPGVATKQLAPEALEALCHYAWPGNMRELENVIQQVAVLTDAQVVTPEDLPIPLVGTSTPSPGDSLQQAKAKVIAQFEQTYIAALLQVHQGNVTQAARAAQTERRAFGRLIKKYHLTKR
jgi:two-component system response regulator GlrR